MDTTASRDIPRVSQQTTPAQAFALMLETACEQFEVLQLLLKQEIKVISNDSADVRKHIKFLRAPHCINMALAKSFVANVIRARRICEHGSQHLAIERTLRRQFLSSTSGVQKVRDVNEHGFDIHDNKSRPMLHYNGGGFVDETAMYMGSAEEILMGPINLYDVYRSVARMRDLAGFASLRRAESPALGRQP